MVDALGDLGIQAELSSRNDITVAGRKIPAALSAAADKNCCITAPCWWI